MEYKLRNDVIRWQISTVIKVETRIFTLTLTVFEILMYQMFDHESLEQGNRAQHS